MGRDPGERPPNPRPAQPARTTALRQPTRFDEGLVPAPLHPAQTQCHLPLPARRQKQAPCLPGRQGNRRRFRRLAGGWLARRGIPVNEVTLLAVTPVLLPQHARALEAGPAR